MTLAISAVHLLPTAQTAVSHRPAPRSLLELRSGTWKVWHALSNVSARSHSSRAAGDFLRALGTRDVTTSTCTAR